MRDLLGLRNRSTKSVAKYTTDYARSVAGRYARIEEPNRCFGRHI
jgi:hypothetical protein